MYQHLPVMVKEVVEYLNPSRGKVFVDCTLGGGGHTEKIKTQNPKSKIIGIDRDAEAIAAARERLKHLKGIEYIHDNFVNLEKIVKTKVDGFLFDLGVSSYQIDEAGRGFSFQNDGPLDMRMDQSQKITAADIVNNSRPAELERIFKEYGEERFAKRISNALCITRNAKRINTTLELKEIIEKAIPTWRKRESITRIFQALRIAVNAELDNLKKALKDSIALLKAGGRIVVISYHSLEDRLVKQIFRRAAEEGILKVLTKKPIRPSLQEIKDNPRARSAKLRAGEKISEL